MNAYLDFGSPTFTSGISLFREDILPDQIWYQPVQVPRSRVQSFASSSRTDTRLFWLSPLHQLNALRPFPPPTLSIPIPSSKSIQKRKLLLPLTPRIPRPHSNPQPMLLQKRHKRTERM